MRIVWEIIIQPFGSGGGTAVPVEHDGLVDGVGHEPLRGLGDVLPKLVERSVLFLQINAINGQFCGAGPILTGSGSCSGYRFRLPAPAPDNNIFCNTHLSKKCSFEN